MYKENMLTGLGLTLAMAIVMATIVDGSYVAFAVDTCQKIHCNPKLRTWNSPMPRRKTMCMQGCVGYVLCTTIMLSDDAIASECLGDDPAVPFAFLDSPKTFQCLRKCLSPKRVSLMGFPQISENDISITPRDYFGKVFDGDLEVILG